MINSSGNNILLLILSIMIARIYVVHILSYNCTEFKKVPLNIESSTTAASDSSLNLEGTICSRNSAPFYIVTYYIKWVTT